MKEETKRLLALIAGLTLPFIYYFIVYLIKIGYFSK